MEAVDPVDALNEIAFWLERSGAPVFKVRAFRRAAATLAPLEAGDLVAMARDGRLRDVPGIGGRSYEVVREAVEGRVPGYLERLRAEGAEPLTTVGHELRARLRGDLHTHSDWSDGTVPVEVMVSAARALGHEYIALTDHSPSLTIANGLSTGRLLEQLELVEAINRHNDGFRLLSGIEVDILEDGRLDQSDDMLGRLDVVVSSVHSKLRADSRTMTERMLTAIENPHTNVLGHCTGRLVEGPRAPRPQSQFDAERVFAACAANDVAVEINARPERQDPPGDLMRLALDAGCLFSINTDAHAPGHLGFADYGAERASINGVPAERIVTTWPLDRLLEWSRARR